MNKNYYDEHYPEKNRDKVLKPRGDRGSWCSGCDANTPVEWKKCSVCGHRNGRKRYKS